MAGVVFLGSRAQVSTGVWGTYQILQITVHNIKIRHHLMGILRFNDFFSFQLGSIYT